MSKRIITFPATLDSANRKRDRSLSLRLTTNLEVSTEDFAIADTFVGKSGWLLFSEAELDEKDVPEGDAPSEGKSQSRRIRGSLFVLWEKTAVKEFPDFEGYYRVQTEKIIEAIKRRIPE